MVKVNVNGLTEFAASEGNGPVNALDGATASTVRVNLTSQSERTGSFTTIGVSTDVIDASFNALYDSYIYYLSKVED